jgi:D-aminopeptidase
LLAEIELFAASLAPWKIRPIFFSGCPVACKQATTVVENIQYLKIDKSRGSESFDYDSWRLTLARAVVKSLSNHKTKPYEPVGPFDARVTMRDGEALAAKLASRWKFEQLGAQIRIRSASFHKLYMELIRLCYLTPVIEKALPLALGAFNLRGRIGIIQARRRLRKLMQR